MTAKRLTRRVLLSILGLAVLPALSGCIPKGTEKARGATNLTVYGFSIMKEPLEQSIYPAFAAKWKREHGAEVTFTSSFAGSETVTNQVLQGVKAEIIVLSIQRDVERLRERGFVRADWASLPHGSVVNRTPFVILVRKGNPKRISDFEDLGRPGLKLLHPDPVSSGGALWSLLAIYGSQLRKSEAGGKKDPAAAARLLQQVWANVIATPGSAREARTQFETGYGDALITYELEGLLMQEAGAAIDIVTPKSTIFSEHPAVAVDKNVSEDKRAVVDAFLKYLWGDEAQQSFVRHHFRSVTSDALSESHAKFARIELPFTIDYLGGWERAYPEIIEGVWQRNLQRK